MSDLIRREEVIEALKLLTDEGDPYDEGYNLGLNTAILEVKKHIPTAEPKVGKWTEVTSSRGGHECSHCHDYAPSYQDGSEYLSNYCPKCGAKMERSE